MTNGRRLGAILACIGILAGVLAACAPTPNAQSPANDAPAVRVTPVDRATPARNVVVDDSAFAGPARVLVYGDSLTWEARRYFAELARPRRLVVHERSYVGSAICDWFGDMWTRIPAQRPDVVVFAFYGNIGTACMQDPTGPPNTASKAAHYLRDASAAVAIALANGAKVVLVGAPRSRDQMLDPQWAAVRNTYRAIARQHPGKVFFHDSSTVIAPGGQFSMTQQCLPRERSLVDAFGTHQCEHGRIIVRAPDGLHFCPNGLDHAVGRPGDCPVYMSGAYRYAREILTAARDASARRWHSRLAGPMP